MTPSIQQAILSLTGAKHFECDALIQNLWSGYGEILRLKLFHHHDHSSAANKAYASQHITLQVIKYVSLPEQHTHPRGWSTELSHQRKVRSYQVESHWYEHWAKQCDDYCRVPACLGTFETANEFLMVLEDLDASGFAKRLDYTESISEQALLACVGWLANFHARFLNHNELTACLAEGLWPIGSYWHLATRPDELATMADGALKTNAAAIDACLNSAQFQTLVHGDAKLANFCFSEDEQSVAALDFQYVGAGCGIKDLVYFMSSCLNEYDCKDLEAPLLNYYFGELKAALQRLNRHELLANFSDIEQEWRGLYPFAWADFNRFLQGWSPNHWKLNHYTAQQTQLALNQLLITGIEPYLPQLFDDVISIAKDAGALIEGYREKLKRGELKVNYKGLGASLAGEVVTEADVRSQELIESGLFPLSEHLDITFVGEEGEDSSQRLNSAYTWLVDPIDGTLSFVENRAGYCVSIALITKSGEPLLGVVFDPFQQVLYASVLGGKCIIDNQFVNNKTRDTILEQVSSSVHNQLTLHCYLDASYKNDSRYDVLLTALEVYALEQGYENVRIIAEYGAALNACKVLASAINSEAALYVKLPKEKGGSLWDYAASAAMFKQLGLVVSDLYGEPLDLNRSDSTYLNHKGVVYASHTALANWVYGLKI